MRLGGQRGRGDPPARSGASGGRSGALRAINEILGGPWWRGLPHRRDRCGPFSVHACEIRDNRRLQDGPDHGELDRGQHERQRPSLHLRGRQRQPRMGRGSREHRVCQVHGEGLQERFQPCLWGREALLRGVSERTRRRESGLPASDGFLRQDVQHDRGAVPVPGRIIQSGDLLHGQGRGEAVFRAAEHRVILQGRRRGDSAVEHEAGGDKGGRHQAGPGSHVRRDLCLLAVRQHGNQSRFDDVSVRAQQRPRLRRCCHRGFRELDG